MMQAPIPVARDVSPPAPTGSNADSPFYRSALAGGVREMTLSKLAQTQASNVEVNRLAGTIVDDLTSLDRELSSAGDQSEPQPTAEDRKTLADMHRMSGALFDRTFLATMEQDCMAAVALFEDASLKAQDSSTRELATTALVQLRKHLVAVRDLERKMIGS